MSEFSFGKTVVQLLVLIVSGFYLHVRGVFGKFKDFRCIVFLNGAFLSIFHKM